jgi:hypothetical protein
MAKIITLQPGQVPDATTKDGHKLYRLPYPFQVGEDGMVGDQDFWRGDPSAVLGFQDDVDVQRVNLHWEDVVKDPQAAVGKFPVMISRGGGMYTYTVAIGSASVREV